MIYPFVCGACHRSEDLKLPLAERNSIQICPECNGLMTRRFTAQIQIISDRLVDRPENKYALGFDEGTRLATMKEDDKAYEASHKEDYKPNRNIPTLAETYQKMWGS